MVMMSPESATTKPAPADGKRSRTCNVNPLGAPICVASSEKECILLDDQDDVWVPLSSFRDGTPIP